jgi:azurin
VVKNWPRIEGASLPELLALLTHSQDLVREHARLQLRAAGGEVVPAVDAWVAGLEQAGAVDEQALLEATWVLLSKGQARPRWVQRLLDSTEPRMRAAAVQTLRFEGGSPSEVRTLLAKAALDPHPRVRMAVVNAVSRLRAATSAGTRQAGQMGEAGAHTAHMHGGIAAPWEAVLEGMTTQEPAVLQMVQYLKAGIRPTKGRSVPVLEVSPASEVRQWLPAVAKGTGEASAYPTASEKEKGKNAPPKAFVYRTFIQAKLPQTVLLNVKHGYLDISANGVQLLTADSPYSSQQQVQFELQKGVNLVELAFRRLKNKDTRPPVFVCDTLGQVVEGASFAQDEPALAAFALAWETAHAADSDALRVQAVPNLLQFSPKEIRVKAGQSVRLIFENPDLMQHNLVLVEAGAEEEVGALADQLATQPEGLAKQFIPVSAKVLHATPLVNPNGRAELHFTAPLKPGSYPYLCTFPGHWRVMRGILMVE